MFFIHLVPRRCRPVLRCSLRLAGAHVPTESHLPGHRTVSWKRTGLRKYHYIISYIFLSFQNVYSILRFKAIGKKDEH